MYILVWMVQAFAMVDYSWHRIYHEVNLFSCWLYLHAVTADLSSLYNGFISHSQPRTWPKDMFVSNAMNSCWDDEEWVMKIYSESPLASGLWRMCGTSLAILYSSFTGEPQKERSAHAVRDVQFYHTCIHFYTFVCPCEVYKCSI